MAEPVIVPIQLEVTDVDMSKVNLSDVQKNISEKMSGVRKAITETFKGIDASAINKPIEAAMTNVKKSVQAAEDAQLRYRDTLIKAGESTKEYREATAMLDAKVANLQETLADYKKKGYTWVPEYKEIQKELEDAIALRNRIDPIQFADKANAVHLEKIANAYRKVLTATDNVNKKAETFNQTIQDNKTTDSYSEMLKDAESYKKKLEELNEKSRYMEKFGATDNQWEKLRNDADWTASKMDEVVKKMREAVKTGQAFRFGDGNKSELTRQINSLSMSANNNTGAVKLRAMRNESPYTEEYQKAVDELDKLEKKVEAIREKSAKMIELGASKGQFEKLAYDATQLDVKVDEVKNSLMNMVNEGKAFKFGDGDADAEIGKLRNRAGSLQSTLSDVAIGAKRAQGGLSALGATHPKLAAVLTVVGKVATVFGKIAKGAVKVGRAVVTNVVGAFKTLGRVISKASAAMSSMFGKRASSSTHSGIKKLTKNILMFGLGFRTAYYLVRRLRNIVIESFKMMGDQFDEVGRPMTAFIEALNRLKGSLATALQPIASVVMPILTRFMNYMSGVLESIGTFMATLTGQGHIYKTVAKNINSVASAAKNANEQLGSYDKLEVIQKNDPGYDFEKQEIGETESAVSSFANMVKDAWEKADFTSVGKYVTTKFLEILDNVEKAIIPKATGLVNKVLRSINTFIDGFGSAEIGAKLGSIVNTIVNGIEWDQLGALFANLNNLVWSFVDGLVNNIDWIAVGQAFADGIQSMFDTLKLEHLVNMLSGLVNGLTTALSTMIQTVDWNSVGTKFVAAIENLLSSIDLTSIIDLLHNTATTLMSALGNAFKESNNDVLSAVGEVFYSVYEALEALKPAVDKIVKSIKPAIKSVLPIISKLLPPIAEIISTVVTTVLPAATKIVETLTPILIRITEAVLPVIQNILDGLQPIFDVLIDTVLPMVVRLLEMIEPLLYSILRLIDNVLEPVLPIVASLLETVCLILEPILSILEPLLEKQAIACDVLGNILVPILKGLAPILEGINWLLSALGPILEILLYPLDTFSGLMEKGSGVATSVFVPALRTMQTMFRVLSNAAKSVQSTFKNVFNSIKHTISSVVSPIKKPINAIMGVFESMANGVIRAINTMIRALNNISFDIPDWVPSMGGKSFGFNLKTIGEVKIPRLAQGAVIPPNREFLAMLGDQKNGTNIEAPLDTIKQAVAEVLAELGGGSREPIILQVNGRTLAKVVWDEQEKRYKQTGRAMA